MSTIRSTACGNGKTHKPAQKEQKTVIPSEVSIHKQLTPRQAVREHCIDCVGCASNVKGCQGDELYDGPCIFHPYRMGKGRPSVKLIRKFCLHCMGGSWKLVKECPSKGFPLFRYRFGKSQSIQLSDEQRQERRRRAAAARLQRLKSQKVAPGIEIFSQDQRTATS